MRIHFLNGEAAGQKKELTPPGISIGRETDNDVQLLVGGVSRYHAKIEFAEGSWKIRDLGSTNGTKLNGEKLASPMPLRAGDIVIMGDQTLRVEDDAQAANVHDTAAELQASPMPQPKPAGHGEPTIQEIPLPQIQVQQPQASGPQIIFQPAPEPVAPAPEPPPLRIEPQQPQQQQAPSSAVQQPAASIPSQDGSSLKAQAKSLFDTLRASVPIAKLEGDIFSKSKISSDGMQQQPGQEKKKSSLGNLVFYVAVFGLAVICVSVFFMMQQQSAKQAAAMANKDAAQEPKTPFTLYYEKQRAGKDNIFRFTLTVENGGAIFTLDDLQNNRHFKKGFANANPVFLKTLEEAVRKSDFMKLQQEPPGVSEDGADETRSIVAFQGGNFNQVAVKNTYAKSSFEDVEMAIDQFAEDFGLKTVSLGVEEMKDEADKAFLKAESLFDNYQARPENLRNAITRYQLTLDYLDQFEPKPKEWDIARKRQQEAQSILDKQLKELEFSFNRNMKLKDLKAAVDDCTKIMEMCDQQDKRYIKAHEFKVKLEKIIRSMK